MKIAIITSGILPVPAVQGGAVENLIDFYLEYNELYHLHDITIYSVYHTKVADRKELSSKVNHYVYIDLHSIRARFSARLYSYFHKDECYSYKLEYFFEQAYKKLKKENFQLIILENRPGFALKLRERVKSTIITHLHTNMLSGTDNKVKKIVQANDKLIVVSNFIKKEVESTGITRPIAVVYNGINEQQFKLKNDNYSISRKDIGIEKNDFVAIYSGRLVPEKGIKDLILSVVHLSNIYPDIKLLVLGGANYADNLKDTSFIEELYKLAEQAKGHIHFMGFVPYEKLPLYLNIANVAVVPSKINDAFNLTCIEASSLGLPIIATNDGGIPEVLRGLKHILIEKDENMINNISKALIEVKEQYHLYVGNKLNPNFTKENYAKNFFKSLV